MDVINHKKSLFKPLIWMYQNRSKKLLIKRQKMNKSISPNKFDFTTNKRICDIEVIAAVVAKKLLRMVKIHCAIKFSSNWNMNSMQLLIWHEQHKTRPLNAKSMLHIQFSVITSIKTEYVAYTTFCTYVVPRLM